LFFENPNAPAIASGSGGVAEAVVYLRGLDPRKGKPWNLPEVRIEQRGRRFHILQGKTESHIGFVRRGEAVGMVSRDAFFYSLHAGGAAFFTLTFPEADKPVARRLDRKGLVELTSAAGDFWMRAYLFVDDHPYYARTDSQGRFTLEKVPPGDYELVCWLPSWRVERKERDPESGQVSRIFFGRAVEMVKPVTVKPGGRHRINLSLGAGDIGN
jgi:hypothetical protein